MKMRMGWICSAIAFASSATANAAVIYSYATDSSTYKGAAGSTVAVSLYLTETLTNGSTSQIAANGGLIGAGAAIDVVSPPASGEALIQANSFAFPSSFGGSDLASYNQGSGTAADNLEVSEAIAPAQTRVFPSGGRVLLGTANVTVGTAPTSFRVTSLFNDTINGSFSDLGQANGNTVAQNGTDFDVTTPGIYTGANDAANYVFTVSAVVPEPVALILVPAALAVAKRVRRRR